MNAYQESPKFLDLADRTRKDYVRQIRQIESEYGNFPTAALTDRRTRGEFLAWRDKLAIKSRRQAGRLYVFHIRCDYGVGRGPWTRCHQSLRKAGPSLPLQTGRRDLDTLQRYCQEGRFDCFKLKTTRNGNPVHEWIINGTSLRMFIQTKPEEIATTPMETPVKNGGATLASEIEKPVEVSRDVVAPPEKVDDAKNNLDVPRSPEPQPDVMATPEVADDARADQPSTVKLLVENAKLTARLESQEDLIGELREDKKFMREQITHQRGNDTLMADMHRETLHTLKAVSVAGRHTRIEMADAAPVGEKGSAFYDAPDSEQRPHDDAVGGV